MNDTTMAPSSQGNVPGAIGREGEPAGQGGLLVYFLVGAYLGTVFTKSEVISWFRIQEMFRFQSIHMYAIIGSAVVVALAITRLMTRLGIRTRDGHPIHPVQYEWKGAGTRYWLGGTIFGLGWALTGACPGPIFTLIGTGTSVFIAALLSALVGTWAYGALRTRLPH